MDSQPEPLPPYRKDSEVEARLDRMNTLLEPIDREIGASFVDPARPTVFVLGLPRSGHTLAAQILIRKYALAICTSSRDAVGLAGFSSSSWQAPFVPNLSGLNLDRLPG